MGSHTAQLSDRVVLVVDDEDMVRQFMARIMTDAGFRVVQARDGEEAATYLQTLGAETISLVISDIAMPRLNGLQLAALMSVHWPTVPILLASGQGGPPSGYQGPFLEKPFEPETLLAAVAELVPMNAPSHRDRAS
jgi:DNA-binding NtrC family response regulator